jgi:hypothetical protein
LYAFLILLTTDQLYFTGEDPSWKADSFSPDQEISCLLWNPNVH